MTKDYYIEIKLHANRWTLVETTKKHSDALDIVRERRGDKYPIRVVRVVRTVVFEGK